MLRVGPHRLDQVKRRVHKRTNAGGEWALRDWVEGLEERLFFEPIRGIRGLSYQDTFCRQDFGRGGLEAKVQVFWGCVAGWVTGGGRRRKRLPEV